MKSLLKFDLPVAKWVLDILQSFVVRLMRPKNARLLLFTVFYPFRRGTPGMMTFKIIILSHIPVYSYFSVNSN